MATTFIPNDVTYFKRFRMELDLVAPLPPVPSLPADFAWVPWEERLIEAGAVTDQLAAADVSLWCRRRARGRAGARGSTAGGQRDDRAHGDHRSPHDQSLHAGNVPSERLNLGYRFFNTRTRAYTLAP